MASMGSLVKGEQVPVNFNLPQSTAIPEIEKAKKTVGKHQNRIIENLNVVKLRVADELKELEEYYAKQDLKEATAKVQEEKDVTEDLEFEVTGKTDRWKDDLIFLGPRFQTIAPKYERAINRLDDETLRPQFKQLLNDFRRMFLHSKFIRENDECPRFLDDIKLWLGGLSAEEEEEIFTDKRLKRIYLGAVEKLKAVKTLQKYVETIGGRYSEVSMLAESQLMMEYRKLMAEQQAFAGPLSSSQYDPSLIDRIDVEELLEQAKDLEESLKDADGRITTLTKEIDTTVQKIDDTTAQIAAADGLMERMKTEVPYSETMKQNLKDFQQKLLGEIVKTVDTLHTTLDPVLSDEAADLHTIEGGKKEMDNISTIVAKLDTKLNKAGLAALKPLEAVHLSEISNTCFDRDLLCLVSVVVKAMDSYRDSLGQFHSRAESRIKDEMHALKKNMVRDSDCSKLAHDVGRLHKHMDSASAPHSSVLTALKLSEKMVQEFGRQVTCTRLRNLERLTLEYNLADHSMELVLRAAPLINRAMHKLAAAEEKKRQLEEKKAAAIEKKAREKERIAAEKERQAVEKEKLSAQKKKEEAEERKRIHKEKQAEEEREMAEGKKGGEKENERRRKQREEQKKRRSEDYEGATKDNEARGERKYSTLGEKREARRESKDGYGRARQHSDVSGLSRDRLGSRAKGTVDNDNTTKQKSTRTKSLSPDKDAPRKKLFLRNIMEDDPLVLPYRRHSDWATRTLPPLKQKTPLKFRFYSQGVPVFEDEKGRFVEASGEPLKKLEQEPAVYGSRLLFRPVLVARRVALQVAEKNDSSATAGSRTRR
ncbi:calponin homology domain-containing protein DDB_G0272472 [Aplysia californica]|uniref:Calponin homology domain-containing protein DDB_G0272472 n=1 Tax=Aplysia californica TaxID=6500 RepID=A0ABM1ACA1_APLCA|nr:calponin homology domain-containing protein DDB_G0272472 [Aplysia californica]